MMNALRIILSVVFGCVCLKTAAVELDLSGMPKKQWEVSKYATWENDGSLKIAIPDGQSAELRDGAVIPVDLTPYRGKFVTFNAQVKGEKISQPGRAYLGVKFMYPYKTEGKLNYPDGGNGRCGTFDWTNVSLTFRIPDDIQPSKLHIGLQGCSGTVWYRNIKMEVADPYPPAVVLPVGFRCEYTAAVKDTMPLRGFMSPNVERFGEEDIRDMAEIWHANLVRWQIDVHSSITTDIPRYNALLQRRFDALETLLPLFQKYNIKVIIDLHAVPGGRFSTPLLLGTGGKLSEEDTAAANFRLFYQKEYLDMLLDIWEKTAERFKDSPVVWAYDIYNEPAQSGKVKYDYLLVQYLAAQRIRTVDPDKPIIVTANDWGSPLAFQYLHPLPLKNIIYELHMYIPGGYTHQGIGPARAKEVEKGIFVSYPPDNPEIVAKALIPVREFQQKYGARIFVGEFSTVRYAPDGARYLEDIVKLFEDYGWDWCYHSYNACYQAFPEQWNGFSLDHPDGLGNDINMPRSNVLSTRKKVIMKYLKNNLAERVTKQSAPEEKILLLPGNVKLELIKIPAGSFCMGSPSDENGRFHDEIKHQVTLSRDFWLGKYEVTQQQYQAVMGNNPSAAVGETRPVENVSYHDALAFAAKLTELERTAGRLSENWHYTLPTEAQWEYTCRAGTETALNNGQNLSSTDGRCRYLDVLGVYAVNATNTHEPVGSMLPNNWGLFDMHGNVSEWCLDRYGEYPGSHVTDPAGAIAPDPSGEQRVFRGGNWYNYPRRCRAASRMANDPGLRSRAVGFRLALVDGQNMI